MYTNIDGIVKRKLQLTNYLKEKKAEVACLGEIKLSEDIQTNIENDDYNIWRKDRKVLQIGCSKMRQRGKYSMENEWINKTNFEKYLGVWITLNLSHEKH